MVHGGNNIWDLLGNLCLLLICLNNILIPHILVSDICNSINKRFYGNV